MLAVFNKEYYNQDNRKYSNTKHYKEELNILNFKVKISRIERGYKQIDLASKVGITPQYLRLIETGKANPTREIMKKIANELGKPVEDLFF